MGASSLAGVAIVLTILASAIIAGYESIERLLHPQDISYLGAVMAASIIGFLGNEAVAMFRIRVGEEINSAALVADGYHARVDAWTSLAVLFGAAGVWLGYPLADPIVGLLITAAIFGIVIQSGKSIFVRMLDGADPDVIDELRDAAAHVPQVEEVAEVARALARAPLARRIEYRGGSGADDRAGPRGHGRGSTTSSFTVWSICRSSSSTSIPRMESGEAHHRIEEHAHDGLAARSMADPAVKRASAAQS